MDSLCINLTSPAILEHLKLNIQFRGSSKRFKEFFEDLRNAYAWTRLDSITSHPTLQRVDINIDYSFRFGNDVLNAVLAGLPLLRTKGILFVESVSEYII